MLNSANTFPNDVKHLPKKNQPNFLSKKGRVVGNVVNIGGVNPFVAFRTQYRDMEHKRVLDGVKQNALNNKKYYTQYTRNSYKNVPTGSFNRGFHIAGNSTYPSWINQSGFQQKRGGFRTQEGQEYGQMLLKKRAEQFDEIRAMKEGQPFTESAVVSQPEVLDVDDANIVAIDLLIQSIQDNFVEGAYDEIKTEELRKLFNALKTYGFQLPKPKLQSYYYAMMKVVEDINTLNSEMGDRRLDIDDLKKSSQVSIKKIYALLETLMKGYELDPKQQKLYIKTAIKTINKINEKSKDIVLPPPPQPQIAVAGDDTDDDSDAPAQTLPTDFRDLYQYVRDFDYDDFNEAEQLARHIATTKRSFSQTEVRLLRNLWIENVDVSPDFDREEGQILINRAGFRRS